MENTQTLRLKFLLISVLLVLQSVHPQATYWGVTSAGGVNNGGTIYSITESNVFTKHYDFQRVAGATPKGDLLKAANGRYYGVTELGGTEGTGVLFSYDPNTEVYSVLANFTTSTGNRPIRGLLQSTNGRLYGLCSSGGANGFGTIYEFDITTNNLVARHSFNGTNGRQPWGRLVQAPNGRIYGTTLLGGANNVGVIFSVTNAGGSFSKHHDFAAATGAQPVFGLTLASNGLMYGTTQAGGANSGGVIYSFNTTGNAYTVLFNMVQATGRFPNGELTQAPNGLLYGTTTSGGALNAGVLYSWNITTSAYTKLHDMTSATGTGSLGRMLPASNGLLYGMTTTGGTSNQGVIYSFNTGTNTFSLLASLNSFGYASAFAGFIEDPNGELLGMSSSGGSGAAGALFRYSIASNTATTLVSFNFSTGAQPQGPLVRHPNGLFFGVTTIGGVNNQGVLFSFDPATATYTRIQDFGGTNGSFPSGGLALKDGKLFGLCTAGGASNEGTLFEYAPGTSTFTKRVDLGGVQGGGPITGMTLASNGLLYGLCNTGGTSGAGTLFGYDADLNILTKLADFNNSSGTRPAAPLMEAGNGVLYGVLADNAQFSNGSLFSFDPSTNTFTKLYNFDGLQGGTPSGQLVQVDGKLWGICQEGSLFFSGCIYSWDIAGGTYTEVYALTAGTEGSGSTSNLIVGTDGLLYGTCREGGTNNIGTIFRFNPMTDAFNTLRSFNTTDGNLPSSGLARESEPEPPAPGIQLSLRAFLGGPYAGGGLMNDGLRALGTFPLTEPYTDLGFAHTAPGETILPGLLSVTGNDAVVDWVLVELRDKANSSVLLHSRAALLQRDGDVVGTDGASPITFDAPEDEYFVALRHRNHLGVMTLQTFALSDGPTALDLTNGSVTTFGTNAQQNISGVLVSWPGNTLVDNLVKYTGSSNDRDPILVRIGGTVPTATVGGYFIEDVNLDGSVKYTGANNDRDPLLVVIGGTVPTATRSEQLP